MSGLIEGFVVLVFVAAAALVLMTIGGYTVGCWVRDWWNERRDRRLQSGMPVPVPPPGPPAKEMLPGKPATLAQLAVLAAVEADLARDRKVRRLTRQLAGRGGS
jgi:hypothetical protein